MGVQLGEIVPKEKIKLENLDGRKIAIDAFNSLFQFLSIIRQPDGTPLMDSKGRVTSHLTGLLYRTGKLIEVGIKPVYVFDGEPPRLKKEVVMGRHEMRKEAKEKWKEALKRGEKEKAKRYAQQASALSDEMIEDSKKLLEAMGVPVVQAPGEGEAQAAYINEKNEVWSSASQDYDSLLFGSPRLIRNLTITGKRKLPRKNVYVTVETELIELKKVLEDLGVSKEQLVEIGILVGTDFNAGIKGVGPKTALSLVKEGKSLEEIYKEHDTEPEVDLDELRKVFLKPDITDRYKLKWEAPDRDKILNLLVKEHDFSQDRVEKVIEKLEKKAVEESTQSRLEKWV